MLASQIYLHYNQDQKFYVHNMTSGSSVGACIHVGSDKHPVFVLVHAPTTLKVVHLFCVVVIMFIQCTWLPTIHAYILHTIRSKNSTDKHARQLWCACLLLFLLCSIKHAHTNVPYNNIIVQPAKFL